MEMMGAWWCMAGTRKGREVIDLSKVALKALLDSHTERGMCSWL